MTLRRKYIPWSVRVQVAERQLGERMIPHMVTPQAAMQWAARFAADEPSAQKRTLLILKQLGLEKPQLDHDPALEHRDRRERRDGSVKYTPDELSPAHLKYMESAAGKNDHGFKTYGRKPDAERTVTTKGSDAWLAKKFRRLEGKTKASRRAKQKIPQRKNPWGNQSRKLKGQSRWPTTKR